MSLWASIKFLLLFSTSKPKKVKAITKEFTVRHLFSTLTKNFTLSMAGLFSEESLSNAKSVIF